MAYRYFKYPVHYFFLLILTSLTDFFPNVIFKNFELAQAALIKSLKFVPYDKDQGFSFKLPFILLSLIQSLFFKEGSSKKILIIIPNTKHGKMIFTLLDKVIVVYIKLILIYIKGSSYKKLFLEIVKMVLGKSLRL